MCGNGQRCFIRRIQCLTVSFLPQIQTSIFSISFSFSITESYGLRGRELINNVGKVMLQGGGTFGTFMAIGTGIRC